MVELQGAFGVLIVLAGAGSGQTVAAPHTLPATSRPARASLPVGFRPKEGTTYHQSGWPTEIVCDKDGAEMVLVPAGTFLRGTSVDEADRLFEWARGYAKRFDRVLRAQDKEVWIKKLLADEQPQRSVHLDAYYIDKHEVTNARFRRFVEATGYETASEKEGYGEVYSPRYKTWLPEEGVSWRKPGWKTGDDHPVVMVNYGDVQAYCRWAGTQLPTEAQWEKAARGSAGNVYPWGAAWDGARLNAAGKSSGLPWGDPELDDGHTRTAPVGSFPKGVSAYGCHDMAGNVWEWCRDWYTSDYYAGSPNRNPHGPTEAAAKKDAWPKRPSVRVGSVHVFTGKGLPVKIILGRVLRGGSWYNVAVKCRAANRNKSNPATRSGTCGFRCVLGLTLAVLRGTAGTQPGKMAAHGSTTRPRKRLPSGFHAKPGTARHAGGLPMAVVCDKDGSELLLVPAGVFARGTTQEEVERFHDWFRAWGRRRGLHFLPRGKHAYIKKFFSREQPQRAIHLDAYYMGKYEVTNARFRRFVDATGHRTTAETVGFGWTFDPKRERWVKTPGASWRKPGWAVRDNHPVVMVTWDDATAYCRWAGARLPTEAQWEKAARGTHGFAYPWGNAWDGGKANSADATAGWERSDRTTRDGHTHTAPVGSFASGVSPFGCCDMAGNVSEWCRDWYKEDYYVACPDRDPMGPDTGQYRVVHGGSWYCLPDSCRSAVRGWVHPTSLGSNSGFRVSLSLGPAE